MRRYAVMLVALLAAPAGPLSKAMSLMPRGVRFRLAARKVSRDVDTSRRAGYSAAVQTSSH